MAKKPSVTTLASGFNSTGALNTNFTSIRDQFDNTLSLDGSVPNAMEADLDINNNDLLNVNSATITTLTNTTLTGDSATFNSLTVDGANINAFTAAYKLKLDNIEDNATADQTASEIRTLVESATDSNVFTDADHSKLNAVEDNATADQTKADIDALNINADLLDGQHGSYYTGYADTAVSNLVDSAPSTLDTLNELAAALGDDASFSTTVTNSIATKMPLAGGTFTGSTSYGDNDKIIMGVGNDLQIYSDGDASHIDESGTGNFVLKATNIQFTGDNNESLAWFVADGAVSLYHNGIDKAQTTSSGFNVSGNITASGTVDGRDLATDGGKLDLIEASADVTDTTNVTAAGALMDSELTSEASVKALDQGVATTDGVTHLSLNVKNGSSQNSITSGGGYMQYNADTSSNQTYRGHIFKIRGVDWLSMADYTTASEDKIFSRKKHVFDVGAEVTGDITVTGAVDGVDIAARDTVLTSTTTTANAAMPTTGGTFTGDVTLNDNEMLYFGTSSDSLIYHNNVDLTFYNNTGHITITNAANDKDVVIESDDSFNNTTQYFRADGSTGESILYHYGNERLSTRSYGGFLSGGTWYLGGNSGQNTFIVSERLDIKHGGYTGHGEIVNDQGNFTITNTSNNYDVSIQTDNGSGGYTDYFKADGSTGEAILYHYGSEKIKTQSYGAQLTGDMVVTGTVDGVDIAARDAVLTSTTTTANAAMPKSGGTFTGDISFEGATANDYETTVTVTDPTADRTITLPDQSGTAMLWQSAWPDDPTTGAGYNIAIGETAFNSATSGSSNIAIGKGAMYAYTIGQYSVGIGTSALGDNQTYNHNVAVGHEAGRGNYLLGGTYVGSNAGNYNYGNKWYQTAIGYMAMNDQAGDESTAVGAYSMSDGHHHQSVAVGYDALGSSSTFYPYYNVVVGAYAGNGLYSGDNNVIMGYNADVVSNATSAAVAIGTNCDAAGTFSVSIGADTSTSSTGYSDYCVLIGRQAGYDMDGGNHCTFIGNEAGRAGGTGSFNNSVGSYSLYSLTDGTYNSVVGAYSFYYLTSGDNNCSLGHKAGHSVTTGSNNTFLGYNAGFVQDNYGTTALTTGSNVTCVGYEAVPSSATATNEITLGDNDITSLRCNVQTISSLSDERDKTAIKDLTYGLDFINDMRPVEFTWNRRDGSLGAKTDMGFIAQDLYETELNHSSSSRTRLVNWENPEKLEADYVRSYPILVKAVQELSAKCDALQARIETLEGN